MGDSVQTEIADGVAVLTINRPEARNSVNKAVAEELAAAVDETDQRSDVVVVILTGAGGTFCAGMDLKAFTRGERPIVGDRGFAGFAEQPPSKPVIAAVEGYAVAGGCELALSCDLVVASAEAKFGLPEVKRGLVAAGGGLLRLPKALPYQVAMEAALTGEPLTAQVAHQHGLVNRVTEAGGALAGARELGAVVAENGPLAVRATKRIVSGAVGWTDAEAFEWQRPIAGPVQASADAQEGARAFAEKRKPVWRGE